jgi:hypothetical protein
LCCVEKEIAKSAGIRSMTLLHLPYLFNILILVPVGLGSQFNLFHVSRGHFPESAGWRSLTGSLWTAILVGSILDLFQPVLFSPLLLLQVVYKTALVNGLCRSEDTERRQETRDSLGDHYYLCDHSDLISAGHPMALSFSMAELNTLEVEKSMVSMAVYRGRHCP